MTEITMGEITEFQGPTSPFGWEFIDDLSAVTEDDNVIIEYLLHRLEREEIYTWVGPLLLALNPGGWTVRDLYDESHQRKFTGDARAVLQRQKPHIYAVASRARYRLVHGLGKSGQVIVISGESGTGKTFNARKALDFLAATNEEFSGFVGPGSGERPCQLVKRIGNVFPLLSAFSTASTQKNARSSRHGQLLRLQYDKEGLITGASIHSFLLERTRVTAGSNNFEIFYQLAVGLSDLEIDELGLSRDGNYSMLGDYDRSRETGRFLEGFRDTVGAFEALGFADECKIDIFRVIALLMHMGNIRFVQKPGEGCTIDLLNEESKDALRNACALISVREEEMTELLTTTLICPQSLGRRHTTYRRELKTSDDCRNRLFSIARYIYDRLFHWLVDRVNESLSGNGDRSNWLGILDIFGFESFETNGLEQLCINYSTERLQLHFMEDYLEAGQRELRDEGLEDSPPSLTIQLYRERLSVIEGIVFSTFNDACQSPLPPSVTPLRDQFFIERKSAANFLKIRNDVFVIEHYSCPVEYTVEDLLSKNTDKVPTELSFAFANCNNKLLRSLSDVEEENIYRSGGRASRKKCTALAKLKRSLDRLVEELNKCDSHYVRCARPRHVNELWEKNEFREQLACTGIFDALPLARCKFPIRFTYEEFHKRYCIKPKESGSDLLRYLSTVIDAKDLSSSVHLGNRLIFLTETVFFELEHLRKVHRSRCATRIQSFWAKSKHRREMNNGAEKPSRPIIEEVDGSSKDACGISIVVTKASQGSSEEDEVGSLGQLELAQQDEENNNCAKVSDELRDRKKDCEMTNRVYSADTGYRTAIMGDKYPLAKSASQFSSDVSKNVSCKKLPICEKLVEIARHPAYVKPECEIAVWKKFYVRNWLEENSGDPEELQRLSHRLGCSARYSEGVELPNDATLIVDLDSCPFFYRNRILSRRRLVEIPVRFHTRLTCLAHSHQLPRSLIPRGLEDCLSEKIDRIGCCNRYRPK